MEQKQEQDRQEQEQVKQILAQEQAKRKLMKLNLIEDISSIFDSYENLIQNYLKLQSENVQLKKLLVDKEKEPVKKEPIKKEPVKKKKTNK